MFGLFKRTKIENWEVQLLRSVILTLPGEYSYLIDQIDNGLLKGVLIGMSDIPGYIAFTFHSNTLKKYDRENEPDFKLTNLRVYDKKSSAFLNLVIYVSSGTISGYSLEGKRKYDIDLNKLETSGFKKAYIENADYNRISALLDSQEKRIVDPSSVYVVVLDEKEYFHIKDIEDGDFIGIDLENNIYRITHDPFEISMLKRDEFKSLFR